MNLKHLTDQALLRHRTSRKNEKKATIVVLYHLKEVDRGASNNDLKISKPRKICQRNNALNYRNSEAYRRVAAMNLLTRSEIARSS